MTDPVTTSVPGQEGGAWADLVRWVERQKLSNPTNGDGHNYALDKVTAHLVKIGGPAVEAALADERATIGREQDESVRYFARLNAAREGHPTHCNLMCREAGRDATDALLAELPTLPADWRETLAARIEAELPEVTWMEPGWEEDEPDGWARGYNEARLRFLPAIRGGEQP